MQSMTSECARHDIDQGRSSLVAGMSELAHKAAVPVGRGGTVGRFGAADCVIGTTGPPRQRDPTGRRLALPSRPNKSRSRGRRPRSLATVLAVGSPRSRMRRRQFIPGLRSAAVWSAVVQAQQPAVPVIGCLSAQSADDDCKKYQEAGMYTGRILRETPRRRKPDDKQAGKTRLTSAGCRRQRPHRPPRAARARRAVRGRGRDRRRQFAHRRRRRAAAGRSLEHGARSDNPALWRAGEVRKQGRAHADQSQRTSRAPARRARRTICSTARSRRTACISWWPAPASPISIRPSTAW